MPSNLTHLQDGVFSQCTNLKEIELSKSLTSIGSHAFYECSSLEKIALPEGVKKIGDRAFRNCINLKEINLPDTITTINEYTFYGCKSLTTIIVPNMLSTIKEYAFFNSGLKQIVLPKVVNKIEVYALAYCMDLTNITILSDNINIFGDFLKGCDNVTIYGYSSSYAETYAKDNNIPFIAIESESSNGKLIIYDYDTGEPIPNTKVEINTKTYTTDDDGVIEIIYNDEEELTIIVIGYDKNVVKDIPLNPDDPCPVGLTQDHSFDYPFTKVLLQGTGRYRLFTSNVMEEEVSFENIEMSRIKPGARITALIVYKDGTRSKQAELLIHNYNLLRE